MRHEEGLELETGRAVSRGGESFLHVPRLRRHAGSLVLTSAESALLFQNHRIPPGEWYVLVHVLNVVARRESLIEYEKCSQKSPLI